MKLVAVVPAGTTTRLSGETHATVRFELVITTVAPGARSGRGNQVIRLRHESEAQSWEVIG